MCPGYREPETSLIPQLAATLERGPGSPQVPNLDGLEPMALSEEVRAGEAIMMMRDNSASGCTEGEAEEGR